MPNLHLCVRPKGWRALVAAIVAAGSLALSSGAEAAKTPRHAAQPAAAKTPHAARSSPARQASAPRVAKASKSKRAAKIAGVVAVPAAAGAGAVAATAALAPQAGPLATGTAAASSMAPATGQPEAPHAEARMGTELVLRALSLLGVSYKLGGNTPDTGLDCSGFVRHVFREAVGLVLPRRAEEISRAGEVIADTAQLKPGDLVFFNTLRRTFSHVGIYIGNNQFVHAPSSGGEIRVENLEGSYWVRRFNGARRVLFGDSGADKMSTAEVSALTGISAESLSSALNAAGAAPRPSASEPGSPASRR